uniref:Uncharacterized protein n=1 Tax=Pararge aegeria TaxID=116150 RepID=S4PAK9_9NEOP
MATSKFKIFTDSLVVNTSIITWPTNRCLPKSLSWMYPHEVCLCNERKATSTRLCVSLCIRLHARNFAIIFVLYLITVTSGLNLHCFKA